MRNKILFYTCIYFIILIGILQLVLADLSTDLEVLYDLTTSYNDLSGNNYHLSGNNISIQNESGIYCNGATNFAKSNSNIDILGASNDFTIMIWTKPLTSQGSYATPIDHSLAPSNWVIQQDGTNQNSYYLAFHDGTGYPGTTKKTVLNTTEYSLFTIKKNSTTLRHYVNDFLSGGEISVSEDISTSSKLLYICAQSDGLGSVYRYWKGWNKYVLVYSRALSLEEIGQIYNNNSFCNPVLNPSGCGAPIKNMTINSNLQNTTTDSDILIFTFNGTLLNDINDIFDCSLNISRSINQTLTNINLSNNYTYNFTVDFSNKEQIFNISILCNNTDGRFFTSIYTYIIDNIISIPNISTNDSYYINQTHYYTVKIYGVLEMLGLIVVFVVLLIIGVLYNNWIMQIFTALFSFALGFMYGNEYALGTNNTYLLVASLFIIVGVLMFMYGSINALNVVLVDKKDNNNIYGRIYKK